MSYEPNSGASVLLLEDDWDHRNVFRNFLEHRGWVVREATRAETARALLALEPIDVIVVDLGGTNGWALLEEMGRLRERPRLLCLTGDARPDSRARATALGADAYLVKPIPLRALAEMLERLAGRVRPSAQAVAPATAAAHTTEPDAATRSGDAAEEPGRRRPVVLLLEDDEDARAIYRDMLDFAGYEVMAASDGEEGLRFVETRVPDVVVTDLHMPGMNGVEVARTLREETPACPAIIAVTADSLGVDVGRKEGETLLFDEVLVKPVSPGDLVRTVRAYVAPEDAATA